LKFFQAAITRPSYLGQFQNPPDESAFTQNAINDDGALNEASNGNEASKGNESELPFSHNHYVIMSLKPPPFSLIMMLILVSINIQKGREDDSS